MNNINNLISEELGKMSQLFNYQRGKVISEQASNVATDVGAISQELNKFDSDETKIVNIIKKYNNKASFKDFANQYKTIIGKKLGDDLYRAIRLGDDSKEIADLKKFFSPLGIEFKQNRSGWDFSGIDVGTKSPPPAPNNGLTNAAIACIKQYNGTAPKPAKTPGFVYVTGANKTTIFFSKDYQVTYSLAGGITEKGQWSCKGNVLNIEMDDYSSWSEAQGGWSDPQPEKTPNNGLTPELTACIKQYNGTAPKKSADPEVFYIELVEGNDLFFGIDYEAQYQRKGKPTIFGKWSCKNNVLNIVMEDGDSWSKAQGGWSGPQSKKTPDKDAVVNTKVKTGNTQKLSALTQDVQKSIGGKPTGKISSQELDSILQRLEGNDVSGEVSQSLPTDASGKPDLDKILASLSQ